MLRLVLIAAFVRGGLGAEQGDMGMISVPGPQPARTPPPPPPPVRRNVYWESPDLQAEIDGVDSLARLASLAGDWLAYLQTATRATEISRLRGTAALLRSRHVRLAASATDAAEVEGELGLKSDAALSWEALKAVDERLAQISKERLEELLASPPPAGLVSLVQVLVLAVPLDALLSPERLVDMLVEPRLRTQVRAVVISRDWVAMGPGYSIRGAEQILNTLLYNAVGDSFAAIGSDASLIAERLGALPDMEVEVRAVLVSAIADKTAWRSAYIGPPP